MIDTRRGKTFVSCRKKHGIQISDVQGKLLFSNTHQGKKTYTLSNLVKSGVYIVTIKSDQTITRKKIRLP